MTTSAVKCPANPKRTCDPVVCAQEEGRDFTKQKCVQCGYVFLCPGDSITLKGEPKEAVCSPQCANRRLRTR